MPNDGTIRPAGPKKPGSRCPTLPSLLIGVAFLLDLGSMVEPGTLTGPYHPGIITAETMGLFFLIYLIYILMAYTTLKRNVLPEA